VAQHAASAAAANADATRHRPRSGKTTSSRRSSRRSRSRRRRCSSSRGGAFGRGGPSRKTGARPGQLAEPDSDPGCATGRCPTSALLARSPRTRRLFRARRGAQLEAHQFGRPAKPRLAPNRIARRRGAQPSLASPPARRIVAKATTVAESASRGRGL
uniref:Transcriptional regulator n=1 Tax=Macrostomum lignano TaxID=282301 RepID=A0A1I8FK79_9PLAT